MAKAANFKPEEILGFSGLIQEDGIVTEEFHKKLQGALGMKIYREMADNSSVIGSVLYAIKTLVRQLEWTVEPADDSAESKVQAEFLESCIIDMDRPLGDLISEALSMLVYGWAYFEIIYKLRKGETDDKTTNSRFNDGKFGWRKVALRGQTTLSSWKFEDGDLIGMNQTGEGDEGDAFVPLDKAILFRTEATKDNPEGRSLLRNSVISYWFHKRIGEIEAIGIDRDMTGLMVMEVPTDLLKDSATSAQKSLLADFKTMLGELKRDQRDFAVIPPEVGSDGKPTGYKLRLLTTPGSRPVDTTRVRQGYKIDILQSMLAQFLDVGMQGVGSMALASTHTDLFAVSIGFILDVIKVALKQQMIDPLYKLNGAKPEVVPSIVHGDLESQPLNEIAAYITALSQSGQLPPDEGITRKLLSMARLPVPKDITAPSSGNEPGKVQPPMRQVPSTTGGK